MDPDGGFWRFLDRLGVCADGDFGLFWRGLNLRGGVRVQFRGDV